MIRYSTIREKEKREIVLLQGKPCVWGKCAFCDYIEDNDGNLEKMISVNEQVLKQVTGEFGALEVINSGSVFELPEKTMMQIREIGKERNIHQLYFESYWGYRHRLSEIRDFFQIPIRFKCGIETFDNTFRTKVLNKGFTLSGPGHAAKYFDSICLLVCIKGQTKEMIQRDIDGLLTYFQYGCVNIFQNNTTSIKEDLELRAWFREEYAFLKDTAGIDVLWEPTDFGVGGEEVAKDGV